MIYGSVCSGIEAASVAWHPLGWRPSFFSEVDAFPRAVLAHHYPDTPLHGDFTTIEADQYAAIDVLVGGTPCQSFSVAGLRAGLADERGNLALEFCRLARRLGPRWIVWENVPGVLSLDGGRAFASILGGLAECGYGLAYRVLDAQFVRVDGFGRAVPQRRRRVFVVGCAGDWRRAAAVLFERESLSGNPPPRRESGKGAAPTLAARTRGGGGLGTDFDCDGGLVAKCLSKTDKGHRDDPSADNYVVSPDYAATLTRGAESAGKGGYAGRRQEDDVNLVAHTLNAKGGAGRSDSESETFLPVAHAMRADGFDASEDGTGRGTPLVPICFDETQITSAENRCNPQPGDPCHPLAKGARPPTLAFQTRGSNLDIDEHVTGTIGSNADRASGSAPMLAFNWNAQPDQMNFSENTTPTLSCSQEPAAFLGWRVRRLTPTECERLQGFPDGYTAITYRGKPAADGPRYKALGNSMACNVMRWIGTRIDGVEKISRTVEE